MKKKDVEIGRHYTAKVSGHFVAIRIDAEDPLGGWTATNTVTGRTIKIRTAGRLRGYAGWEEG